MKIASPPSKVSVVYPEFAEVNPQGWFPVSPKWISLSSIHLPCIPSIDWFRTSIFG